MDNILDTPEDLCKELQHNINRIEREIEITARRASEREDERNIDKDSLCKSFIKNLEKLGLTETESTHRCEQETFLEALKNDVLALKSYKEQCEHDIKHMKNEMSFFEEQILLYRNLSAERKDRLKSEEKKRIQTYKEVTRGYEKHKTLLYEVIDLTFGDRNEGIKRFLQDLWDASNRNDGDPYVKITPANAEFAAVFRLISLVKKHPHDNTRVKLYTNL